MNFFTKNQVLEIHSSLISDFGGIDGIRDEGLLELSINSPLQTFDKKELYPSIYDKSAQLCYSLIENHPFLDGNKRIGIHLSLILLSMNNEILKYTEDELITFGLGIAAGNISKEDIKTWFLKHKFI